MEEKYNSNKQSFYHDKPNKNYQSFYHSNKNNIKNDIEEELLIEEYERYKNYLMIKKECPACHFIQGMIFSGIGFFCFIRMHHFRETFSRNDFLKLFAIAAPSLIFGIYKFSYANYIFGVKSKMDQLNKFLMEK